MFAWGENSVRNFYLNADNAFVETPEKLGYFDDKPIKAIAGADEKCALLLNDGSVHTYSSSSDKSFNNFSGTSKVTALETLNIIDISAGGGHIFVINDKGNVYGWGMNNEGQLGWQDGTQFVTVPKLLKTLSSCKVCQVSCGKYHTIMLTQSSMVYTMGQNTYGQLGVGSSVETSGSRQPMLLSSLNGLPISYICAGGWHSFVLTVSGKVFGWGKNDFGQLGLGNLENKFVPNALKLLKSHPVMYVTAGDNHSAVLTKDGGVFTFGASEDGQLGHGFIGEACVNPRQVMELMGSVVTQISCGKSHTLAFVPSSGHLYNCGSYGQLENQPNKSYNPSLVKGPWEKMNMHQMQFNSSAPNAGLYMQEVFAYGNQSFAIVGNDARRQRDFRVILPQRKILTINNERCDQIFSITESSLTEDIKNYLETVLKSQSCLNGSFLESDHLRTNTKYPGVNLMTAKLLWNKLCNSKHIGVRNCILQCLSVNIIPLLPSNPPDIEALRIFITLPECEFMQQSNHYFQLLVPFAARLSALKKNPSIIINNWHSTLESSFFLRRVDICKDCIVYILKRNMHSGEARTKLIALLEFLRRLNTVNNEKDSPIISFEKFYIPELHNLIPLEADYQQWVRGPESAFGFCHYSFVFNAIAKTLLLQIDAKWQMIAAYDQAQGHNVATLLGLQTAYQSPTNEVTVRRNNLVQDALTGIVQITNLKKPFVVKFDGEEGQDAGGVRKEFFVLILKEVVDPKYGMFRHYEESRLLWFADYDLESGHMYNLIGILCGLAIYNNTIIDLNFPLALYKKVLNVNPTLSDLKELDPTLGRSLQNLLDFDEEVSHSSVADTFCLTFSVNKELFGEVTSQELIPDGENINVTADNRKDYVDAYINYVFNESVKNPFNEFNQGFHRVCGGKVLQLFRPEELMEMVVGNINYNWEELEKSTQYKGEYYRQHPVIDRFWKVFHDFSLEEKKQYLLFLTGCSKVPISGLKMFIQSVACGDDYLPVAHTCFNLLDLPKYSTKEVLHSKLKIAMGNAHGFHLA